MCTHMKTPVERLKLPYAITFYHSRRPHLPLQRYDWLRAVVNLKCFTRIQNLGCQYQSKLLPAFLYSGNRNAGESTYQLGGI